MSSVSEYANSRPLDVNKRSEYKDLLAVTKEVWEELYPSVLHTRGASNKARFNHLRIIIIDLIKAHREDPTMYLGYSRNKNSYGRNTRNHKLHFTHTHVIETVNSLQVNGYIDVVAGFHDKRTGIGKQSRMRAAQKLMDVVNCHPSIADSELALLDIDKDIFVILRDKNKRSIPFEETKLTKKMHKQLVAYNKLLEKTYIDIDLEGYNESVSIDLTNKVVRRVFNNESWEDGGRYYGGWWQNLKRELRDRIILGETFKPYYEKDYSGLHVVLLYAKDGISYFDKFGVDVDPYDIGEFDGYDSTLNDDFRRILKLILLVCLNTKRKGDARKAVLKKLRTFPEDYGDISLSSEQIAKVIDLFINKHEPIKHYFFKSQGVKLQNIDSKIASEIIDYFISEHLPVLCIHDSFICSWRDSLKLDEIMDTAIKKIVKNEYGITLDSIKIKDMYYLGHKDKKLKDTMQKDDTPFFKEDMKLVFDELQYGVYKRYNEWLANKQQCILKYNI